MASEPTDYLPLRDYQAAAIREIESQIASGKREMLVAMATGTGKTITCIGLVYRLIKPARFRRFLFLLIAARCGEQSGNAFKDFRLENYQTCRRHLRRQGGWAISSRQRNSSTHRDRSGHDQTLLYPSENDSPVPVDWYDCIVVDECHRCYNLDQEMSDAELSFRSEADYISKYRRVIDHFDAVRIVLTATPALHTTQIFGPPLYQYTYRQASLNAGWWTTSRRNRLVTALAEDGMKWSEERKTSP